MSSPAPKLFQPIKVGPVQLNHRVVLAPLTRYRADDNHVPLPNIVRDYYSQRASTPGTLVITEGTFIAQKAGGYKNVPGIWSEEQIKAWKEITDAVHAQGSSIFMQLWSLGGCADPATLEAEDPSLPYICISPPSNNTSTPTPRPLTATELHEYVQLHATAASNAVHKAGFDGVEIHSANGYLLDQSLQDVSNSRTDEYGGSVENRTRFALEVVEAVVNTVGAERTAIRLSPWSKFNDMGMKDPIPTFSHLVTRLSTLYPTFAYIHVVEPRIIGNADLDPSKIQHEASNDFLREIWKGKTYITAGGYVRESGLKYAEENDGHLVAFGRWFIPNPDLPVRLRQHIPLAPYDRSKFYLLGEKSSFAYSDYPFAKDLKN